MIGTTLQHSTPACWRSNNKPLGSVEALTEIAHADDGSLNVSALAERIALSLNTRRGHKGRPTYRWSCPGLLFHDS